MLPVMSPSKWDGSYVEHNDDNQMMRLGVLWLNNMTERRLTEVIAIIVELYTGILYYTILLYYTSARLIILFVIAHTFNVTYIAILRTSARDLTWLPYLYIVFIHHFTCPGHCMTVRTLVRIKLPNKIWWIMLVLSKSMCINKRQFICLTLYNRALRTLIVAWHVRGIPAIVGLNHLNQSSCHSIDTEIKPRPSHVKKGI